MGKRTARVVSFFLVVFLLGGIGAGTVVVARFFLTEPAGYEGIFEIRPGETLRSVSRHMERLGIVGYAKLLELYGRYKGYSGRLQAGRYVIAPDQSPVRILSRIVSGDAVFNELTITIPEGWSVSDIERYFEDLGLFSVQEFQVAVTMQEEYRDFTALKDLQDDTILDGYLFPDTYRIFSDSTPRSIVRRMLANFENKLPPDTMSALSEQGRSLHELLTLASIVQAESGVQDMPDVAGVFVKRIRDGIRLESDATVNYVLGTSKLQPTFADTEIDHPYNTYENYGLPPGPIGNPGIDAIRAALHPADNPYYFFLHRPDGQIVLSRTFSEHLENKRRYLD